MTELADGRITNYTVTPEQFGFLRAVPGDLLGGGPEENARIVRAVLAGEKGARRDIVLMNAGAAIYVGGRAATLADGIRLAAESIDSGRAAQKLDALVAATRGAA